MKSTGSNTLFGIRRGVVITIGALLVLVLVLFLLFALPGIRRHGAQVTILTDAPGAAVFVADQYVGSTPLEVFILRGQQQLSIEKPYYTTLEATEEIPGRLLFTLLAPRKHTLSYTLKLDDPAGYLAWRLQDLYQWSMITNYSSTYRYPGILADTASDLMNTPEVKDTRAFGEFVSLLPRLASSDVIEEDILTFAETLEIPVPAAAEESFDFSGVYSDEQIRLPGRDIGFIHVGGTELSPYYISTELVSRNLFLEFTEDEPFWSGENKRQLIDSNLADDTYLHYLPEISSRAVLQVSWYAARAFASWLDEQYPQYRISLPLAVQYDAAAELFQLGKLWQWSETPFYPGTPRYAQEGPKFSQPAVHRVLRGGSSDQTASMPESMCSPVTGFRLVLERK